MGVLHLFGGSLGRNDDKCSSCDKTGCVQTCPVAEELESKIEKGNPSPLKYTFIRSVHRGQFLLVEAIYPGCENYEGRKIMLFGECTLADLQAQKTLDPHFSDNPKFHSPIARFEPTEDGWNLAVGYIDYLIRLGL